MTMDEFNTFLKSLGGGSKTPPSSSPDLEARLIKLEQAVSNLTALLEGVKRVTAPDGTPGISIAARVGICTEWFLHQPAGSGATFSVAGAQDPIAGYFQHDGDQVPEDKQVKGRRVALMVRNTDPNATGTNIAIDACATNAPHGNIAVDASAQYSPDADEKVTIIRQLEWKG